MPPTSWARQSRRRSSKRRLKGGEVYVAAENAFNRHYEYFPGYEMPGTMVYIGCKLKF